MLDGKNYTFTLPGCRNTAKGKGPLLHDLFNLAQAMELEVTRSHSEVTPTGNTQFFLAFGDSVFTGTVYPGKCYVAGCLSASFAVVPEEDWEEFLADVVTYFDCKCHDTHWEPWVAM